MRGFVTVKLLMYQTNRKNKVGGKYYEFGYSRIQELNNSNQQEQAFKDAVSNAGQKYAYHSQQKYEDVEYNYDLIDSWVTYIKVDKKTKRKYYSEQVATQLTPSDKRRLHKEVKDENARLRQDTKIKQKQQKKIEAKTERESLTYQKEQFRKEIERERKKNLILKRKLKKKSQR